MTVEWLTRCCGVVADQVISAGSFSTSDGSYVIQTSSQHKQISVQTKVMCFWRKCPTGTNIKITQVVLQQNVHPEHGGAVKIMCNTLAYCTTATSR